MRFCQVAVYNGRWRNNAVNEETYWEKKNLKQWGKQNKKERKEKRAIHLKRSMVDGVKLEFVVFACVVFTHVFFFAATAIIIYMALLLFFFLRRNNSSHHYRLHYVSVSCATASSRVQWYHAHRFFRLLVLSFKHEFGKKNSVQYQNHNSSN